jgi:hypothetical protein
MYTDEETSSLFSIIIMANMTLFLSQVTKTIKWDISGRILQLILDWWGILERFGLVSSNLFLNQFHLSPCLHCIDSPVIINIDPLCLTRREYFQANK